MVSTYWNHLWGFKDTDVWVSPQRLGFNWSGVIPGITRLGILKRSPGVSVRVNERSRTTYACGNARVHIGRGSRYAVCMPVCKKHVGGYVGSV